MQYFSSGNFISVIFVLSITLLPNTNILNAQSSTTTINKNNADVQGILLNHNKLGVSFATVAILNLDSVIVGGEMSLDDGSFHIPGISSGTYIVMVQHLEFQTYYSEKFILKEKESKILSAIQLQPSSVNLDEVVVTGRKALIEIQADKLVFNVSSSPSASGTNGLELLRKSPGVIVDLENNISLQGKGGVLVYINGVASRLAGNDLATMLESITSDNVESIEIITNPSSKYEAEGNAGIINIRLKKNVALGFNGTVTSSVSKGNFYRNSNSLGMNYGTEKLKISFDINRSQEDIQDDLFTTRKQNGFLFDQKSYEIRSRVGYNVAMGIDYMINAKHTLSFTGRTIINKNDSKLNSNTQIINNAMSGLGEVLYAETNTLKPSENFNYNLNYKWTLDKTSSLGADLSLGNFNTEIDTYQPNTFFASDGTTIKSVINNEFNANTYIDLWSAKVDFEKSWNKITFSGGGKYAHIATDNNFAFFNILNNGPVLDITKSNDFTYTEKVLALYAILNAKIGKLFTLNAGLRMENTASRGRLISDLAIDNKDVPRNYTDLFPNVGISFNDQKNHSWSVSIGRRITRPSYQDLNPFESPLSQLSAWKGNPFLRPNYIMNYQLSYSFKQKLTITNTYSVTNDFFATIFEKAGEKGTILIPRNMDKATNNGLSVSYPLEVNKYWDFIMFLNGSYQTFKGDLEGTSIDLSITNFNFRIQNNLKLPYGITMDVSYNRGSDWIWRGSIRIKGNQGLSFGIRKEFFDKNLQLRITGSDIFRTDSDYFYYGDYGGISTDGVRTFDNQRFGIGATLKFGNQKAKVRKKSGSALDEELNRLQGSN